MDQSPRARVKKLWVVDYASIGTDNVQEQVVATFIFDDEKVASEWLVPHSSIRRDIEQRGRRGMLQARGRPAVLRESRVGLQPEHDRLCGGCRNQYKP